MKLAKITHAFKHRLFLATLIKWLDRNLKVRLCPYYLMQEGYSLLKVDSIRPTGYETQIVDSDFLKSSSFLDPSIHKDTWEQRFSKGHLCIALVHSKEIAAYCWADTKEFNFRPESFPLGPKDAYLYDAYTCEAFRGKGLAPYMRQQCYKVLKEQGYEKLYSVTETFNTSSKIFKAKLNAQFVHLYLKLDIRKKEFCHITLRTYKAAPKT